MQKNKIHRHKEDIQKRIQNIQKKIQNNSGVGTTPSTAITTNRRQLLFNNDKSHYSRNEYANRSAYQPSAPTGIDNGQNNKRELVGARRTFSYGEQDYQTGYVLRQKYERGDIHENRIQSQIIAGSDIKQKSNKYLNQYLTMIQPQNKSYGRISANRKNSAQNFGVIVSNKQNNKILQENNSMKRVSVQKQPKNNQNIYLNRQQDRVQIASPIELRKNIELEQILKEVVSNQRKLQNQVLQLKSELEKQNQFKQMSLSKNSHNNYKSNNNQNSESVYDGRDRNPAKQNQYFNTKTMKLTDYQVPNNKSMNKKNIQQMSHDPYMITNNMTNSTLNNENEYNYDKIVKIIKQKQHKKKKINEKQKIKIQDEEQNRSDWKSQPKKHLQTNSYGAKDKLKKNILKQKLYSIVKVGKSNTQRYVVPEANKQIFYQQLKNRMEQAELEYTDIMHRNNRFQHERLISANELQKKIRDNALAIIYQQCNKCVYK